MNKMNVCVVGLGTIGGGVCRMIQKYNYPTVNLYAICDRDQNKLDEIDCPIKYHDYNEALNDSNIDLIVEVMGGDYPASDLIKKALIKGINVVSANKEVIAKHYKELSEILKESKARFMFEASVGGVVPIISSIYNYQKANRITKIEGIINGSTNYVLTLMQKDGVEYKEAIKMAKERGFLEADPSSDLKGEDMKRKIVILSNIAYHTALDINDVYSYSLEGITDAFIEELQISDYFIKYMAESFTNDGKVSIRIEPVVIRKDDILASVIYERNYIAFYGDEQERIELMGLGAGRYPTSTSIISDILEVARGNAKLDLDISNSYKIDNNELLDQYIVDGEIDNSLVEGKLGKLLITKKISWKELKNNLSKISFYARIK